MPPLPDAPGVLRIDLRQVHSNDTKVLNRFFVHYDGTAPLVNDLDEFATDIKEAWDTNLKALVDMGSRLDSVLVTDLTSVSAAQGEDDTPVTGTRAGNTLPGGTAVVVSFKVARRYRGGHPRLYLDFGVSNDLASAQTWVGSFVAGVKTSWDAFMTAVLAAGWTGAGTLLQVNVSYFEGFTNVTFPSGRTRPVPKLRVGGPINDPIIASRVNPRPASQRRRNLQGS